MGKRELTQREKNTRFLKVLYRGYGYGHVMTEARPTDGSAIRLERAELDQLAQLFCDIVGEEQRHLHYDKRRLARLLASYAVQEFGERPFCREAARRWVWQA